MHFVENFSVSDHSVLILITRPKVKGLRSSRIEVLYSAMSASKEFLSSQSIGRFTPTHQITSHSTTAIQLSILPSFTLDNNRVLIAGQDSVS